MTTGQDYRRLTKSRTDRMIDGVCGGVAAYFGVDPTLVRVAWVLVTLLGGSGIILYIAAMILMPKAPVMEAAATPDPTVPGSSARSNTRFWGILLVVVGAFWLLGNLGLHFWNDWWWLSFGTVVPVLLILAGVAFLFGGREYVSSSPAVNAAAPGAVPPGDGTPEGSPAGEAAPAPAAASAQPRLTRSITEKQIAGVCGGLALWLRIDPVFIRLAFVMAAIASFGFVILIYLLLALALPAASEPPAVQAVTAS
ncbi:MAG: PspC domain-containing protein [Ignavibacteriae bacterium]|nr:PspC domain-containing protein [Ignavibacteriota bacterium]